MATAAAAMAGRRHSARLVVNITGRGKRAVSSRTTSNLKSPVYPIKNILANQEEYQRSVDLRGLKLYKGLRISDIKTHHDELVAIQGQRQDAATQRNKIVERVKETVAALQKKDTLPSELKEAASNAKSRLAELDARLVELQNELALLLDTVPNLIDPRAAQIEGEYTVVSETGPAALHDPARDHVEIGTKLGILDIASASRVTGTGNAYLMGQGALLEQALVQFALSRCASNGFRIVSSPSLVRNEFNAACGFKPRDEATQIYEVANSDLCLAGTAEIPLASQLAHCKLPELPLKHAGSLRSYRAEAGARGSDTRGLYRLHEFTKVEMFVWTSAEDSMATLEWLVKKQQALFNDLLGNLGVPLRTIFTAPVDLGAPAYAKYDIEAWMPGRGSWGELSSASNCRDFQARRLHTTSPSGEFVHTLNATALAVPRVIVAILENGWDPEKNEVRIPAALQPFMGGLKSIGL